MSYFSNVNIQASDSPSIDAFARWRTSQLTTLFDSKQLYDTGSLHWATKIIGNGTASFIPSGACVKMQVTGSNTSVIRQTRRRFNYQPGKSQLVVCTANFGSHNQAGFIERVGYFGENNGVYFVQSGSAFGVGLRNNGSDTFVSQSNWNLDKFDGTGPSGKSLILSASQIFFTDFEWLGVGRVRYGVYQSGIPTYVHQITNANALPETNPVYMSNPNLPVRYELINSGSSSGSLYHICSMVASEGGVQQTGPVRSVDFPNIGTLTIHAGVYAAAIALRLKSGSLSSTVLPKRISIDNNGGNNGFKWTLLSNPATGSAFTWVDTPNSAVQWATGSNSHTITDEGTKIASGYVASTADSTDLPFSFEESFALGSDVDRNPGTLVLAIHNFGAGTTFRAALQWQESI